MTSESHAYIILKLDLTEGYEADISINIIVELITSKIF